jgi:hypothetical protein
MTFLYPIIRTGFLFILLLVAAIKVNAQEKSYAANAKESRSPQMSIQQRNGIKDPYVKVRGRTEKKVALAWPSFAEEVSHYVIERSIDGRAYQEVGLLFTVGAEEPVFDFTDKFRTAYLGPLYYRLRVERLDGSSAYTPVTTLSAVQSSQ